MLFSPVCGTGPVCEFYIYIFSIAMMGDLEKR